jgi:uncharacterized membrane protein required for colicin V production
MMIWVNIIASLILLFSLIGGLKEGAVKQLFYLIALLIAIPVAGISYHLLANLLSFIPGENWENFLGFFIMLALISVILYFVFLLPRRFAQKVWKKGLLFRLIGAALNIFNAAIGMVVFTLVLGAYPIFGWLEQVVTGSGILTWLVVHLSFVQAMLPEVFRQASTMV